VTVTAVLEQVDERADEPATRDERIAALRRRLAVVPARGGGVREAAFGADGLDARPREGRTGRVVPVLPVPPALAEALPRGGLVRGTVVSVAGASSLLLGLLASVTAEGGWAGVVGRPGLGLLAAVEMGADLGRLALVPYPGPDAVDAAAVLLDGLDLVVLDLAGAAVSPSRARGLVARARHRGGVLVVTGGSWPGAELVLRAEVGPSAGLGPGHGRLRSRELLVAVHGRGEAVRGRHRRVLLRCAGPDSGGAAVGWEPARSDVSGAGLPGAGLSGAVAERGSVAL
jgi:hypothetical protein